MKDYEYLLSPLDNIEGIGKKTQLLFKKKNINNIFDLLWHLPISKIENLEAKNIENLQLGKLNTIKVVPIKYNFPRIRNLPNKVNCLVGLNKLDCIFFNSYEGYIKKILPLNKEIIIKGKASFYKKKYQLTNPTLLDEKSLSITRTNKYSLTEGININKYNKIIDNVIAELPDLDEWHTQDILKKFNYTKWSEAIKKIHSENSNKIKGTPYYKRLVFDEIFAHFLISSNIRNNIKKIKKNKKIFVDQSKIIINSLKFKLTNDQIKAVNEINTDLRSKRKMFRLLQGDVGSGKTIVSIIAAINTINAGYQVCMMVPTEILAKQHYNFIRDNFKNKYDIEILTGKTDYKKRKEILGKLKNNKIDFLIGTHSLFQTKVIYWNLGLIIIDEQHKFGVKQRKSLSEKGGKNSDVLVMSATPIPRTMIMTIYGDMDVTLIKEKPKNRKQVITYSKLEDKMEDVIKFVKKQIDSKNQVFWVCPLINESKKLDHESAVSKSIFLNKYFKNQVGLVHGSMNKDEKNNVLDRFLSKKIDILVSTTVIEVGIDFPNANVIVIENANKYGLSQLHQLRGRVGRGEKEAYCILIFKSSLGENARKRIKILKSSNDGFKISEEDMKLRGYGDVLGFKQSGIKKFRLADPLMDREVFDLAENEIKQLKNTNKDISRYKNLIKLYDKAEIIN